jgi:hypothetical protein
MKDWNSVCLDSIRKEKTEIAKRYNIRFAQTEIYCQRCSRPATDPLKHRCQDLRLKDLQQAQAEKESQTKEQGIEASREFVNHILAVGITKAAILLQLDKAQVSRWVKRGVIPEKHHEKAIILKNAHTERDVPKSSTNSH